MTPKGHRSNTQRSDHSASSGSNYSDSSYHSRSTAPTDYSVRPTLKHYETADGRIGGYDEEGYFDNPRASTETYASTVPSFEDLPEEPQYQVPLTNHQIFASDAIPSTAKEFAELFPSTRTLLIRHDDATEDGNMNLRVDTEVPSDDGMDTLILFHLKMQDLKNRQFSLRRYCRESGREVAHSSRKYIEPTEPKRPGFQRSLSNAISSINAFTGLRAKSDNMMTTMSTLKRQDSGYDSADDEEDFQPPSSKAHLIPTNTVQLEFSNYAHVDVKRRGVKASKQYEYEFWGAKCQWKREIVRIGRHKEISYHLVNAATSKPIAHIVPQRLTPAQAREEEGNGAWIPPCSMWISDPSVLRGLTDVADVIVATGLIALVDDCIKRRWHSKRSVQFTLPNLPMRSSKTSSMETSGPKRLVDEVFGRRGPTATQRPTSVRQKTTG